MRTFRAVRNDVSTQRTIGRVDARTRWTGEFLARMVFFVAHQIKVGTTSAQNKLAIVWAAAAAR